MLPIPIVVTLALLREGVRALLFPLWTLAYLCVRRGVQRRAAEVLASNSGYDDDDTLWRKIEKIATRVYRASEVTADSRVRSRIRKLQEDGYGHYPVCVAKTQYSFSTDPQLRGAPVGHVLNVREVRLAAGAGFVVMICGDIMTMPGLPKVPSANAIDLVDGRVVGLF